MAMENKRIIQLSTERTTLTSGDYVMVDNEDDGSAKYRLDRLKETDTTLSVSGKAADAAATGQAISDEATAREAADTALGEDIDDLKSAFNHICSVHDIEFTQGSYIATNGSVGSVVSLTPNSNGAFQYAVVDCAEGDAFVINGQGWTTGRLWCFIDADNKIITSSQANITVTNLLLKAPIGSAKLILNMYVASAGKCYKGEPLPTQSELDDIVGFAELAWTAGGVIATNGNIGSVVSYVPNANGYFQYSIATCSEGDKFVLNGQGWTTGRLWCFVDADDKILDSANLSVVANNLVITAPVNSAKAIFNMYISSAGTSYKGIPLSFVRTDVDTLKTQTARLAEEIDQNAGLFQMASGVIGTARNLLPNTKRVTTGIVHLDKPFSISIGTGWQLLYMVGGATGTLTDKGWTIVNGGSHNFTLDDGEYFAFNLAKTSLTNIDATTAFVDSKFRLLFDDTNDALFAKSIESIEAVLEASDTKPIYYVDINGGGDYTSLLRALKGTPDISRIVVMPGEYDMKAEYEDYYGADYFVNYSGYDLTDIYSRGYFIGGGRELECVAGSVIKFRYEGDNSYVGSHFCVLNMGMNAKVSGIHIYYKGTKYAIHDDYALNDAGTNYYENIIIEGVPSGTAGMHWGGGCGKKNTYIIKNVVFIDDEMPANYGDIYYHNSEYANAVNRIVVDNCYGGRSCLFIWMGQSEKISYVAVSGCEFKSISARALSGDVPYENVKLYKYNNTETGT